MENKQTAVDWLVNVVQSCIAPNFIPKEIIEQAKEIEEQQKIMDYEMGYINGGNQKNITGEQYIKETYEGNKWQ